MVYTIIIHTFFEIRVTAIDNLFKVQTTVIQKCSLFLNLV